MKQKTIHQKLKKLHESDQRDRKKYNPAKIGLENVPWKKLWKLDAKRLRLVKEFYRRKLIQSPRDMFYAAMIFQHSRKTADYKKALELSKKSYEMGDKKGKWLYPRAEDRYLLSLGKSQIWGTQFLIFPKNPKGKQAKFNGRFNRKGKTTKERKEFGINPYRQLKSLNR